MCIDQIVQPPCSLFRCSLCLLQELLEASRKRASTRGTASAYHRAVVGRLSILSPPATAAHNARGEREEREMPKSRRGLQAQGRGLAKDKTGPSRRVTSFDGIDALQMASAGSRPKYNGSSVRQAPSVVALTVHFQSWLL